MRRASVLAELIPDKPTGNSRIDSVTEGEASLHFVVQNGVLADAMQVSTSSLSVVQSVLTHFS
jgi:hypothetical protein